MLEEKDIKNIGMADLIETAKEFNEYFGFDGSTEDTLPINYKIGVKKIDLANEILKTIEEVVEKSDELSEKTTKTIEMIAKAGEVVIGEEGDAAIADNEPVETKPVKTNKENKPKKAVETKFRKKEPVVKKERTNLNHGCDTIGGRIDALLEDKIQLDQMVGDLEKQFSGNIKGKIKAHFRHLQEKHDMNIVLEETICYNK
jgi:hypothetical protein